MKKSELMKVKPCITTVYICPTCDECGVGGSLVRDLTKQPICTECGTIMEFVVLKLTSKYEIVKE